MTPKATESPDTDSSEEDGEATATGQMQAYGTSVSRRAADRAISELESTRGLSPRQRLVVRLLAVRLTGRLLPSTEAIEAVEAPETAVDVFVPDEGGER